MVAVALRVLADVVPLVDQRTSAGGVAQKVHTYGDVEDKQRMTGPEEAGDVARTSACP